jgi:hypothetical protein
MTGLVRKATLLGVCGLFVASAALASVPDPAKSSIPNWLIVTGPRINGGANPDPVGAHTIIVRDFASQPINGATVIIDFSTCCDINLCSGEVGHDCVARTVSGLTNASGQFSFTVRGGAKDPGNRVPPAQYGGCGLNGVQIRANNGTGDVLLGNVTAVCLDQNGAGVPGQGQVTGGDAANVANLSGSITLGAPYRGRGDTNCSGTVTGADAAATAGHSGRLALLTPVACATFCAKPACP